MSRRVRGRDDPLRFHSLQLLASRRFDLYTALAPHLVDLDEAIDEKNVRKIIETFAGVYRRMRESLAFLSRPLYRSLRAMEEAIEGGSDSPGGVDLDRLRLALLRLHVEMARALREPAFESIEEILDLDAGSRARLAEVAPAGVAERPARGMGEALDRSGRGWKMISDRKYRGAVKEFRKALALVPGEPTFRTDLGQALLLAGDAVGAVAELSAARDRFGDAPGEAGSRRRTVRLLGQARRALSEEQFRKRRIEDAISGMKAAIGDLESSQEGEPDEDERASLLAEIEATRQRLSLWEAIWQKVSALPGDEAEPP